MLGVFIGLLIGAGLLGLVFWFRKAAVKLSWYEWLIGVVGALLVVFGVWHYFASLEELYPNAAWMGLLILGLPGLILLVVAWQLYARGQKVSA